MRGIRFAGAALLLVGAIAAELSVVRTWRLHIAQIPDSYNYTAFTSVCTFFWPSTLAIALIVAGAVNSLRIQPATKGRVVFDGESKGPYFLARLPRAAGPRVGSEPVRGTLPLPGRTRRRRRRPISASGAARRRSRDRSGRVRRRPAGRSAG